MQLLEVNNKMLEVLKVSTMHDNSTFSITSVDIETENMHTTPEEKPSIAELQVPSYGTIPTSVKNISLKDSLKKWHIMNWKSIDYKILCKNQKKVFSKIRLMNQSLSKITMRQFQKLSIIV